MRPVMRCLALLATSSLLAVNVALAGNDSVGPERSDDIPADAAPGTLWIKNQDARLVEAPLARLSENGQELIHNLLKAKAADTDASGNGAIETRLLSIEVSKPAPEEPRNEAERVPFGAVFAEAASITKMKLLLLIPGRKILSFDRKASKVIEFTDDRKTDLLSKASLDWNPDITHDGHQCVMDVTSLRLPSPGATKLLLKARLLFSSELGEKTVEHKNLVPKKGGSFLLGKTKVLVSETGVGASVSITSRHGQDLPGQSTTSIAFSAQRPLDMIRSVEFFRPDGKKIECCGPNQCSSSSGGTAHHTNTYILSGRADSFDAKIVYAEKGAPIVVPVDLESGVGLTSRVNREPKDAVPPDATPANAKPHTVWLKKQNGQVIKIPIEGFDKRERRLLANVAKGRIKKTKSTTPSTMTAELVSIALAKGKAPFDRSQEFDPLASESMEMKILVSSPAKRIICVDTHAGELLRLSDDRGTNLLTDEEGEEKASFWAFGEIYHGGKQAVLKINSPRKPVPEATKIRLEAKLVFHCANREKTVEQKDLKPQGSSFMLGETKVTVSDKAPSGGMLIEALGKMLGAKRSKPAMVVTLTFDSPVDIIKRVRFFGPDGKTIKYEDAGSGSSGVGRDRQHTISCGLAKKVDVLTARITYFDGIEEVRLPVSLEAGLGF